MHDYLRNIFSKEKKYYARAFLYALAMAAVLLAPFVLLDGGYFVYYGDYNAQQIPFYKTCIEAVQSGNLGWNWRTDLGANFVGSYSFYTLGSPFFWFAALFPVEISQYLMAPLLALKIACSSFFAFVYIRRFVTNPQHALIGGLLYATLMTLFVVPCMYELVSKKKLRKVDERELEILED